VTVGILLNGAESIEKGISLATGTKEFWVDCLKSTVAPTTCLNVSSLIYFCEVNEDYSGLFLLSLTGTGVDLVEAKPFCALCVDYLLSLLTDLIFESALS